VLTMMEAYRSGGLGLAADAGKADEWEAKVISLLPGYKRTPPKKAGNNQSGEIK